MLGLFTFRDFGLHSNIAFYLLYAVPVIAHHLFPLLIPTLSRKHLALLLGLSTAFMLVLNIIIFSPSAVFIYFRF
jgi:hypothetical protein